MTKLLFIIIGLLLIFITFSGCTLEDKTVKMKITNIITITPDSDSEHRIGILNMTFYNNQDKDLIIEEEYFFIIGIKEESNGTRPILPIMNITLLDDGNGIVKSGKSQKISINHIQYNNTLLDRVIYEYEDIKISIKKPKRGAEEEYVAEPNFFKTGYFAFILIFVIGVILFIILMGKREPVRKTDRNVCRFCMTDLSGIDEKKKFYCKKWKTRTKRCGAGPFCSKRCLEYHQKDELHES